MRTTRRQLLLVALATGCAGNQQGGREPEYPDSITRQLRRLASEDRPVDHSAMPPRHLDDVRFPEALVDRERIVSGGPPPDGIPAIDDPVSVPASEVDWIDPIEPVMVLAIENAVRAYPVQIMTWHEIVNDRVGDADVAVTYCPLCNSGVAFERTVDGVTLDFGTSGSLYQANLVMYDRQSESLWTQFDGRAVIGTAVGTQLRMVPLTTMAWRDYVAAFRDGEVLSRDTGFTKPYGRNPYIAYDRRDDPVAGFFTGEVDATLPPYARVVGLDVGGEQLAIELGDLTELGVIAVELGGRPLTVWHRPGTASALDAAEIADGADVGATAAFLAEIDGAPVEFERRDGDVVDTETWSTWNMLGRAIDGPRVGTRLDAVVHADTFWFAWSTFQVEAAVLAVG